MARTVAQNRAGSRHTPICMSRRHVWGCRKQRLDPLRCRRESRSHHSRCFWERRRRGSIRTLGMKTVPPCPVDRSAFARAGARCCRPFSKCAPGRSFATFRFFPVASAVQIQVSFIVSARPVSIKKMKLVPPVYFMPSAIGTSDQCCPPSGGNRHGLRCHGNRREVWRDAQGNGQGVNNLVHR